MIRWQPNFRGFLTRKWLTRGAIGLIMKAGVTVLVVSGMTRHWPLIVFNASASVPVGFYRVTYPDDLGTGDLVLVQTPSIARELADARRYLPKTVPMIKYIAASSGDTVCAQDETISINGGILAVRRRRDSQYRPMPWWWNGCQTLHPGEVFLLNRSSPLSFDSRYFGPVSASLIVGKLRAL